MIKVESLPYWEAKPFLDRAKARRPPRTLPEAMRDVSVSTAAWDRVARREAIYSTLEARFEGELAIITSGALKAEAIRACDDAIRQLNLALAYRAREDGK